MYKSQTAIPILGTRYSAVRLLLDGTKNKAKTMFYSVVVVAKMNWCNFIIKCSYALRLVT